jgi:3-oxoacyl-[acyl-carrier-protein] synthase II
LVSAGSSPFERPDGRPRIAITGLGPVSNIGIGVEAFCRSLREGRSGASAISSFDTAGFPHVYGGEVQEFRAAEIVRRIDPPQWGRSSLFAASAARLAIDDAGLGAGAGGRLSDAIAPERVGVLFGTTCGETTVIERMTAELLDGGMAAMSPELARQVGAHRLAHAASEEIGAAGESFTVSTACAASNYALAFAYDSLIDDEADVVVAGGAESVCRFVHAGFYRLGVLAKRSCSPFDRDRSGIITAEGGAALVLERLEHAVGRGARPYAEVLGHGLNCDAHHMVAARTESIADCMRLALRNAGLDSADVDYISAHGTGTPSNDHAESGAVREVFGERMPPTSSTKSMIGHAMGAASGFGAIASVLALCHGFIPPTINWSTPDPELYGIDPVPNASRDARLGVVQNNGFGFGGNNAIVMLGAAGNDR